MHLPHDVDRRLRRYLVGDDHMAALDESRMSRHPAVAIVRTVGVAEIDGDGRPFLPRFEAVDLRFCRWLLVSAVDEECIMSDCPGSIKVESVLRLEIAGQIVGVLSQIAGEAFAPRVEDEAAEIEMAVMARCIVAALDAKKGRVRIAPASAHRHSARAAAMKGRRCACRLRPGVSSREPEEIMRLGAMRLVSRNPGIERTVPALRQPEQPWIARMGFIRVCEIEQ